MRGLLEAMPRLHASLAMQTAVHYMTKDEQTVCRDIRAVARNVA